MGGRFRGLVAVLAAALMFLSGCGPDPQPGDKPKDCSQFEKGSLPHSDCEEFNRKLAALKKAGKRSGPSAETAANSKVALEFFIARGLSRAQAAGIVGNLRAESSVIPSRDNPAASGGGGGIAQWEGNRWDGPRGLQAFAGSTKDFEPKKGKYKGQNTSGNWQDLNLQLAFIWWELNNTEKDAFASLRQASSPEDAASRFMNGYERPKSGKSANEDDRREYAREIHG